MFCSTLLLVATASLPPLDAGDEAALRFAWGDVFAAEAPVFADHLRFGLGLVAVGDSLVPVGARGDSGQAYRLSGAGVDPLHFLVLPASAAEGPVRVQTLVVVENDAAGAADWGAWSRVLHVVRPTRAPLEPDAMGRVLERLVTGSPARWSRLPQHVVAYGLSRSDVRPGAWTDADGDAHAWAVTDVATRTEHVVLDLDLSEPRRASALVGSFAPVGAAGLRLAVRDDDAYDAPGLDLGRASAIFDFDASAASHDWVGAALDLRAGPAPRDLSRPGVALHLAVAGHLSQPTAPSLFLVLVDAAGVEAHVSADLEEITPYEQEVALPLERFVAAAADLDLARLVALRVGVRDAAAARAAGASGSLAVLDPRFVVGSPARSSPLNTFWSNDPARDASPAHPLSDRFLGQPVTAYKYFHGVGGPDPAAVAAVVANVAAIRAHGVTPHVTLELWPDTTALVLDRVRAGEYDAFFRELFRGLASVGGRVELAPFHEGNAAWYPWQGASDPARLRDALRRLGALRDEVRAHNVALGYVVICLPSDPATLRNAVAAFPGDDVVDFVGLQGFESGYGTDAITFNELFTASAAVLRRLTDRPFAVTEFGFSPKPAAELDKAGLADRSLADAVAGRTPVPFVNLLYFNVAKTENGAWRDWRLLSEDGRPVPEIATSVGGLEARAADPVLATAGRGRDAYERRLRAHTRVALRLD